MKRFRSITCCCIFAYSGLSLCGQSGTILGPIDRAVTRPTATLKSSYQDPVALQEITDYQKAVGSTRWSGFEAQGTMTYGSGEQSNDYPATLTVGRLGETRLDVTRPDGLSSLRINGTSGQLKRGNGRPKSIPLRNMAVGLIAFPNLISSAFAAKHMGVSDGGIVDLDGRSLHKVSIQRQLFPGQFNSATARTYIVSDLYFGSDHLLYKSAAAIEDLSQSGQQYLEVVSYANYKTIDGVAIPFALSASLDGQPSWKLQLLSVSPSNANSDFTF